MRVPNVMMILSIWYEENRLANQGTGCKIWYKITMLMFFPNLKLKSFGWVELVSFVSGAYGLVSIAALCKTLVRQFCTNEFNDLKLYWGFVRHIYNDHKTNHNIKPQVALFERRMNAEWRNFELSLVYGQKNLIMWK